MNGSEPTAEQTPSQTQPTNDSAEQTDVEQMKRRIQERPVHAGGRHFTCDELHERD